MHKLTDIIHRPYFLTICRYFKQILCFVIYPTSKNTVYGASKYWLTYHKNHRWICGSHWKAACKKMTRNIFIISNIHSWRARKMKIKPKLNLQTKSSEMFQLYFFLPLLFFREKKGVPHVDCHKTYQNIRQRPISRLPEEGTSGTIETVVANVPWVKT